MLLARQYSATRISGKVLSLVFAFVILAASPALAVDQIDLRIVDSTQIQLLTLHDGSTLHGRIVEIGEDSISFKTETVAFTIPIAKITKLVSIPAQSVRDGKYWWPNPNRTRLFFSPTARMLRQGEGYFCDYYLFFPGFAVGLTDNITLGGGMSLFPGLGMSEQLFYFTPKIGVPVSGNFDLAVGALIIGLPDNEPTVGLLYGVSTVGSLDHSFTFGLGYGFADGELADKPAVMLGTDQRLTRRMAFVSENWVIPGVDDPLISNGIRFFGEKISVDLALITVLGSGAVFPGLPYIDFVYGF